MDSKGIDTLIFSFMFPPPHNVYFLNPGLMPTNMFFTYVIFWLLHFMFLSPEEILAQDFTSVISSYTC